MADTTIYPYGTTGDVATSILAFLAPVATSGSYNDLEDTPNLNGKQDVSNLVTTISSNSTDIQYPSAKCMYDLIGDVETLLSAI